MGYKQATYFLEAWYLLQTCASPLFACAPSQRPSRTRGVDVAPVLLRQRQDVVGSQHRCHCRAGTCFCASHPRRTQLGMSISSRQPIRDALCTARRRPQHRERRAQRAVECCLTLWRTLGGSWRYALLMLTGAFIQLSVSGPSSSGRSSCSKAASSSQAALSLVLCSAEAGSVR